MADVAAALGDLRFMIKSEVPLVSAQRTADSIAKGEFHILRMASKIIERRAEHENLFDGLVDRLSSMSVEVFQRVEQLAEMLRVVSGVDLQFAPLAAAQTARARTGIDEG